MGLQPPQDILGGPGSASSPFPPLASGTHRSPYLLDPPVLAWTPRCSEYPVISSGMRLPAEAAPFFSGAPLASLMTKAEGSLRGLHHTAASDGQEKVVTSVAPFHRSHPGHAAAADAMDQANPCSLGQGKAWRRPQGWDSAVLREAGGAALGQTSRVCRIGYPPSHMF